MILMADNGRYKYLATYGFLRMFPSLIHTLTEQASLFEIR